MDFNPLASRCRASIASRLHQCRENRINKYFQINDYNTYGDSYSLMDNAREVIARYAKSRNVQVQVYDAATRKVIAANHAKPETLVDKIVVSVRNLATGKTRSRIVSADPDATHIFKPQPKIDVQKLETINPITKQNKLLVLNRTQNVEDTFLRNLYRNIADLADKVTSTARKK